MAGPRKQKGRKSIRRAGPRRPGRPIVETLEERRLLTAIQWISTSSGDWNVGSNWSTGQVPGAGDDVTIDVAGASPTVTISSGSQSVHSLTAADPLVLSGGSLALASSSTISGAFTLGGGTLNLNGPNGPLTLAGSTTWTAGQINNQDQTVTNTGSITLNDSLQVNFGSGSYSSGGTLLNQGTIFQTGAGGLSLSNNAAIDNAAGGTYYLASDSGIALGGFGGSFANEGTVEKTAGTGTSTIAVPFNNQGGTVAADSGTLSLAGGGTSTGGTYNASSGATIDLADHTQSTLTGTYTGSGAGAVNVGNNAINIGQAGATFDFPSGLFQWSSGNINCNSGDTLTNTGSITVKGSTLVQFGTGSDYVGGGTLVNKGLILETGPAGLEVGNGATVDNAAGGTFELPGDLGISAGFNGGSLTNAGTLEKTAGTGTSTIAISFSNHGGAVLVQSGTLSLTATNSTSTGGSVTVAAGSLSIAASSSSFAGVRFTVAAGSLSLDASNCTFTGDTFTVAAGATMDPTGGNSDTLAGCTFTGGGTVAFSGGSIAIGIGGITTNVGNFDWSGGSINSALGDLTNLGTMTISGTAEHEFFNDGTIDDRGTIVQTGTGNLGLHSDNQFPTTLLIEPGASYLIEADSGVDNPVGGQMAVINNGTIEKAGGTGVSTLLGNGTLTNGGTIEVATGTLQLATGTVASTGGRFTVAQGARLDLTGGSTVLYSGAFTGSGTGLVVLDSGQIRPGSAGATFDFPAGLFLWTGGNIDLLGNTLTNAGAMTLDAPAGQNDLVFSFPPSDSGGTFINAGTITLQGAGALFIQDEVALENRSSGLLDFAGDGGIGSGFNPGPILNAGTVEKTGGTGTSTIGIPFSNTGTVEAGSGTLAFTSSVTQLASNALTGGTWNALNGATLALPSGTTIATNQATVTLQGTGATMTGLGSLAANSGSLSLLAGAGLTTPGPLSNSGSLTLGPGSTLTVAGDFTQGSSGSLQFQIGGTPASGGFGQVSVTGSAALAGTIDDALVGKFGPAAGTTYQVMTFASQTGQFATVDSPQFHGGAFLQVQTNPGNVTLSTSTAVADLALTSATLQTSTAQPGQAVTVNYQVTDQASTTPVSSWVDSIFLTSGTTIDSSALLLGRVTHTGAVAAGGQYSGTLTAPLPPILPGTYNVLVEVDSRGLVPDANRANNLSAATTTLQTTLPVLNVAAPGTTPTPSTGTIANGEEIVFQATLTAGEVVQVAASTGAASGVEVLASFDSIPTEANATAHAFAPGQTQQQLSLTATQSGTYDIVLVGQPGAGNGTSFSLTGQQLPFLLKSASPSNVGNTGSATLTITGGELAATDTFTLLAPGGSAIPATSVQEQDGSTIYATFDLTGAALGTYALSATSPTGQVVSLPGAVTVQPGQAAVLKAQAQVPSAQRIGRPVNAGLFFQNTGNVDMPAPLFIISNGNNDNLQLSFSGATGLSTEPQFLMGISPNGPAGILQPGAKLRIPFFEESLVESGESGSDGDADDATGGGGGAPQQIQVQFETATSTDPVDYAALSQSLGLAPTDPVMRVIENKAGPTWGGLVTLLDQTATDMKQAGGNAQSAGAVLSDLVENAAFQADGGVSGQVVLAGSSQATAVAGTSVELTTSDGTQTFGGVTAADGSFQITSVPAGTYTLTVSGYVPTGSSTVTVPANGRLSGLQIAVQPGGQIGGSIFNPAGGRLAAVTITAAAEDGSNLAAVTTGPSGTYNLSGLSPGTYDLTVTGSGLGTQYLKGLVVGAGTSLVQNITLAAAASVAGTVFANGVSLAGAQAILTDAQGDAVGAVTDANGNYSLTGLGAGTYTLEVSGQGFAPTDTTLTLTAGQTSQAPGIGLIQGASLSLTVTDPSANPITNGSVEVDNASGIVALLATDANGQASLAGLAAGTYFVHSFASGFLDTVDTITLAAGATVSHTEILQPAGIIGGVVTDPTGSPIANEQVTLFGKDTLGREFSFGATTASDGSYKFTDLPLGSYGLTVGNNEGILRQDATITAAALQATVNLALAGSVIQGTAFLADGTTPLQQGEILLLEGGAVVATATSGADGGYLFSGVAPGSYRLAAADAQGVSAAANLTVTAGATATAGALALGNLSLGGTVEDGQGHPVAGALVTMVPALGTGSDVSFSATTAADGTFTFPGLAPGSYRVDVESDAFASSSQTISLSASTNQVFTVQTGFTATGQITFNGDGVSQAAIAFIAPTTGQVVGAATTDTNGDFTIANLPAGTYDVLVSASGYQIQDTTATVTSSGLTLNIVLQQPSTFLNGVVTDSSGAPITDAQVALINGQGEVVQLLQTAFDGSWQTSQLAPGTYSVQVTRLGYTPAQPSNVVITTGSAITVNAALATAATDNNPFSQPLITIDVSGITELFGAGISFFLQSANPTATRSSLDPNNLNAPPLPQANCSDTQSLRNQAVKDMLLVQDAFAKWQFANRAFNQSAGAGSALAITQLLQVAAEVVQLVAAPEFDVAIEKAQEAKSALTATENAYQTEKDLATVITTAQSIRSVVGDAIDLANSGVSNTPAAKAAAVFGILGDLFSSSGIGASLLENAKAISSSIGGPLGVLGDAFGLLSQAFTSYQAASDASKAVLLAQNLYLKALNRFTHDQNAFMSANANCPPPPTPPPPPNPQSGSPGSTDSDPPRDPNDITGPAGFGTPGFIAAATPLPYQVDFQNVPTAAGAAAVVTVTQQLSTNLDWNTFQLGSMGFGSQVIDVPAGRMSYSTVVNLPAGSPGAGSNGLEVQVQAAFNPQTGLATWTFTSIDPTTGDVPIDPSVGFLPPDDAAGDGEGFVSYSIQPAAGDVTGTPINAQATVVFDTNAPLNTASIVNTIDTSIPTSSVASLPATTTSPSFTVSWSGNDGSGSGIATYDIFVSDNGGAFQPFLTGTTATSAAFTGQVGHTYSFFSVATSNVGLVQSTPAAAQATTTVVTSSPSPSPTPTPTPSPSPAPSPTPTPTPSPAPAPVTVTGAVETFNKKHQLNGITVDFSGALDAALADLTGIYSLIVAGKKHSFTARNAKHLAFQSAAYDNSHHTVTLVPRKPVPVKKPLELTINGTAPSGLRDGLGRLIDGSGIGQPGTNADILIGRGGARVVRVAESDQPAFTHRPFPAFGGRTARAARP